MEAIGCCWLLTLLSLLFWNEFLSPSLRDNFLRTMYTHRLVGVTVGILSTVFSVSQFLVYFMIKHSIIMWQVHEGSPSTFSNLNILHYFSIIYKPEAWSRINKVWYDFSMIAMSFCKCKDNPFTLLYFNNCDEKNEISTFEKMISETNIYIFQCSKHDSW